jgi:hypothetical protein
MRLKHGHPSFASDIWLLFEAVGAQVRVGSSASMDSKDFTMTEFLSEDLNGKVILSFHLKPLHKDCVLRTFKVWTLIFLDLISISSIHKH